MLCEYVGKFKPDVDVIAIFLVATSGKNRTVGLGQPTLLCSMVTPAYHAMYHAEGVRLLGDIMEKWWSYTGIYRLVYERYICRLGTHTEVGIV